MDLFARFFRAGAYVRRGKTQQLAYIVMVWPFSPVKELTVTVRLLLLLVSFTLFSPAETVEILRDEYGVPHVFASTAAGAAFGSGYAQAEDRLEELLKNYRRAEGTMAEAFGSASTGGWRWMTTSSMKH